MNRNENKEKEIEVKSKEIRMVGEVSGRGYK